MPEGIRTSDPRLRRPLLYPAELQTQKTLIIVSYFYILSNINNHDYLKNIDLIPSANIIRIIIGNIYLQ